MLLLSALEAMVEPFSCMGKMGLLVKWSERWTPYCWICSMLEE